MARRNDLQQFVEKHLTKVDGWAGTPESLLLHELFMGVQVGCDNGGAFEIGVHHGRYLIALHNACQPGTSSLGIDLFDDQALNVDGSGSGDLAKARANLDQFAREPERAHLQSADSLALTDEDLATITATYAPFRIASVDGGHTPTHAAHDIRAAAQLIAPGGLISVDDFFHPNFPGVTEGTYAVLRGEQTPFIPWLVTRKKLFLAHISLADTYRDRLVPALAESGHRPKSVTIAGHDCLSLYL